MVSENKQFTVFFHWGLETILITILVTIFFLIFLIPMLKEEAPSQILKYGLAILLVSPILSGLFICPLYLKVNNNSVKIKKPLTSIDIPFEKITSVKEIKFEEITDAIRTFGSGGYFWIRWLF